MRDAVRIWSLRLAPYERGLRVLDVGLLRSEDSTEDSEDEDEGSEEEEEEAEEEAEEEEVDGDDGEKARLAEEGGTKDSARVRKKGEVERVGRMKRPPPCTRPESSVAVVDGGRLCWVRVRARVRSS